MKVIKLIRDVKTRWNSTNDMLDTSLNHRPAIDKITQDRENGLRSYELTDEEWEIARQMKKCLSVCQSTKFNPLYFS